MLLSAATHEKIRSEIAHFPHARGALLYALHLARDEVGSLNKDLYTEIGEHFDMRAGEVAEVASFYSLFNQPKAQAIIQVCVGLPCCINDARDSYAPPKKSSARNPAPRPPTAASPSSKFNASVRAARRRWFRSIAIPTSSA